MNRRPPVEAVLAQARDMIAATERLDMARLSADFGVDRTTLFRWVGNRDQLLVEVLWSVTEGLLRDAVTTTDGAGPEYVAGVLSTWAASAADSPEVRALFARDPEHAVRLLAARSGEVHRRLVAAARTLHEQERAAGSLAPGASAEELPELIVAIATATLSTDLIAGDPVDADRIRRVIRSLIAAESESVPDRG